MDYRQKRTSFLILIAIAVVSYAFGDIRFSIRYSDKSIYSPGDVVSLKLTISNTEKTGTDDETFYLADDPRQSFGFNLRSAIGIPVDEAEGYTAALMTPRAYRVVHLAPGQELSLVVALNDWVDITEPDQYVLTGFFYTKLRGGENTRTIQAESVLDLSILPKTDSRASDILSTEIRDVLTSRGLSPWEVVNETFANRAASRYNRAIVYLNMDSLVKYLPTVPDASSLEKLLLNGSWRELPGMEFPAEEVHLVSSLLENEEATVRARAAFNPYGEMFSQDIIVYLDRNPGYWAIRRMEYYNEESNLLQSGSKVLTPPEVVTALILALKRGDWDRVLKYFDIENLTKNQPEYRDQWKDMSATEHNLAVSEYRRHLITGNLDSSQLPLQDIEDWAIIAVNYTAASGNVVVTNSKVYPTLNGPLEQETLYTFYLERPVRTGQWTVIRYDVARMN